MKKIIVIIALALTTFACKSTSAVSTKSDNKKEAAIKGNWTLTSVTYPGSEFIKVNAFQIADSECFEGSTWSFVANNNKGSVTINKADCAAFSSPITWYVNKEEQFILKVLNAGVKAKKVRDGYALRLANQTNDSFQLIDKIDVGGKINEVVYQFQKN